ACTSTSTLHEALPICVQNGSYIRWEHRRGSGRADFRLNLPAKKRADGRIAPVARCAGSHLYTVLTVEPGETCKDHAPIRVTGVKDRKSTRLNSSHVKI